MGNCEINIRIGSASVEFCKVCVHSESIKSDKTFKDGAYLCWLGPDGGVLTEKGCKGFEKGVRHNSHSEGIYRKVIQAEIKAKIEEDEKIWYKRACKAGICPKCGSEVGILVPLNPSTSARYGCVGCPFDITFRT